MTKAPTRAAKPLTDAQVAVLDHDENGKAGGSKKRTLSDHELTGLFAEAFEAHDYQDERIRFDTLGRRWLFRPDKRNSESVLSLILTRLEDTREDYISTAILGSDLGLPLIEDVVRALDKALA